MAQNVVIKSFPNGISLHMNSEVDFPTLLEEIGQKFVQARGFFKQASMALSLEGRELSDTEEIMILETIMKNSDLHIMCLVGHDEEKNRNYIKALDRMELQLNHGNDGKLYKGSLTNGDSLESENNVVILGDVNPGCMVRSSKSIIILGGLYGEAYAGQDGYVLALEMEPEKLFLGDFKYKSTKASKWGIHQKVQPKLAYTKNEKVVMEPLTKELLSSL